MQNIDVSPAALDVLRTMKSLAPMSTLLEENRRASVSIRGGEMVRVTRSGGAAQSIAARFTGADRSLVCVGTYDAEGNRTRARILTATEYAQEKE